MLTFLVAWNILLTVLIWAIDRHLGRQVLSLTEIIARFPSETRHRTQSLSEENETMRATIDYQEKLIAMLWFHTFGIEAPEAGSHVPSGKLNEVDGIRPRLVIDDPLFVSERLTFSRRDLHY